MWLRWYVFDELCQLFGSERIRDAPAQQFRKAK